MSQVNTSCSNREIKFLKTVKHHEILIDDKLSIASCAVGEMAHILRTFFVIQLTSQIVLGVNYHRKGHGFEPTPWHGGTEQILYNSLLLSTQVYIWALGYGQGWQL